MGTEAAQLLSTHAADWAALWTAGIEVTGAPALGRALNSSLYYLLSAMRECGCGACGGRRR
jgi:trehalose/maltose hydrolase-like predicted phosphorylase